MDHFMCMLACLTELNLYSLYLQSSPAQEAGLLVQTKSSPQLSHDQEVILSRMRKQWSLILKLESSPESNAMLKSCCPHSRFFCFRETMTLLEEEAWQMTPRCRDLLAAWNPPIAMSANIEQIFNNMEDATKRSCKNSTASMSSLQCLAIRSVRNRLTCGVKCPKAVHLSAEDYEGKQVRSIKPSVWKPDSCGGCD